MSLSRKEFVDYLFISVLRNYRFEKLLAIFSANERLEKVADLLVHIFPCISTVLCT